MCPSRTSSELAERVSNLVYIALIRLRSPIFKKHLRHRRELCAGPHARSPQFVCNFHANMGRSMGENVRRKVWVAWRILRPDIGSRYLSIADHLVHRRKGAPRPFKGECDMASQPVLACFKFPVDMAKRLTAARMNRIAVKPSPVLSELVGKPPIVQRDCTVSCGQRLTGAPLRHHRHAGAVFRPVFIRVNRFVHKL